MSFIRLAPVQHDTLDGVPEPGEHALLLGHHEVRAMLAGAHKAGRLHHGLLLCGASGIGKATLAYRLALHLLNHPRGASAPDTIGEPDPASPTFRAVAQGAHPSVLHLTRPENDRTKGFKTVITVEEVRRVGRFLSMTAHDGGWRVVIVDPVDDLNTAAANALLKSLEEPPPRTLFALVAHQPGRLLPTIRSRCQRLDLAPLPDHKIVDVFAGLGLGMPEDAAQRAELLRRAEGSVRAAIMLTEYGGLEIAAAVDALLAGSRFDVTAASRVADAVTGREKEQQFGLFSTHVEALLSGRATQLGAIGDAGAAARLADSWAEFGRAAAEADTFNLDRRQLVMSALRRAHQALGG
jgi:DNA polymerase-3 subunit delta'